MYVGLTVTVKFFFFVLSRQGVAVAAVVVVGGTFEYRFYF